MKFDRPIFLQISNENLKLIQQAFISRKPANLIFEKSDFNNGGNRVLLNAAQLKRLAAALADDSVQQIGISVPIQQLSGDNGFSEAISKPQNDPVIGVGFREPVIESDDSEEEYPTPTTTENVELGVTLTNTQIIKLNMSTPSTPVRLNFKKDMLEGPYILSLTPEQARAVTIAKARNTGVRLQLSNQSLKKKISSPVETSES